MELKQYLAAAVLAGLVLAETLRPFFSQQFPTWRGRLTHDGRNFLFAAINAAFSAAVVAAVFLAVDGWATEQQFGLLRQFELNAWLETLLAIVLIDIWMYWWHRLNHRFAFLWRFHRMHHSDPAMNASTGVRFHLGEIFLSWLTRLVLLPLLGVSIVELALYESLALPVVVFHHSNLRFPLGLDRFLNALIVTPAMHRVHHSKIRRETDSNYSSLLSCWDRVFRTMRRRDDLEAIDYGLPGEISEPRWQTLKGMLRTPIIETSDRPMKD